MTVDLTTHYGPLTLRSPIAVGACPLMAKEQLRRASEDAGAGLIVLPSLFEEQVLKWNQRDPNETLPPSPLKDSDEEASFGHDAWTYLSFVNQASALSEIPVLASINGSQVDHWVDFACELEEVGASGIELNVYHPPSTKPTDPRELENSIVDAVTKIREAVLVPVFVKLSRHYTSVPHLARRMLGQASGLVLFGRAPDIDICLDDCGCANNGV